MYSQGSWARSGPIMSHPGIQRQESDGMHIVIFQGYSHVIKSPTATCTNLKKNCKPEHWQFYLCDLESRAVLI